MAGRKQHHIPRMVLRGFVSPRKGKADQTIVFSKQKTFVASIDDVAAERHFYSKLSTDGTKTLDDLITHYEGVFSSKFFSARDLAVGGEVDQRTAAEIVAHLTIRNAHLRKSFSGGFRDLIDHATKLFCNEENLRLILGVDGKELLPHTKKNIDEEIAKDSRFLTIGLPHAVLYKVALMAMKENFNRFLIENLPSMQMALQFAAADAPEHMRRGHNEALAQGLAPDARTELLANLIWSTSNAPPTGAILPDCVALGVEAGGLPQALIMTDLQKVDHVFMPLTAEKMLIGRRAEAKPFNISNFNEHAAACSYSFFVSQRVGSDLDSIVNTIGERTRQSLEEAMASAFEGFKKEHVLLSDQRPKSAPVAIDSSTQASSIESKPLKYAMSFKGIADEQTARRIAAMIEAIVVELRPTMSLDRLDGFTFAEDYEAALQNLDRGFAASEPLRSGKSSYGVSVARTPLVMRDGVAKAHVVARMWIANGLLAQEEEIQRQSIHIIVQQLAHVAYIQLVDEVLPEALSKPIADSYEAFLFPYVDTGWSGYFGARASAIFDPSMGKAYGELITSALSAAQKEIPAARLAYRYSGDLEDLLRVTLPHIGAILGFAGKLLGHYDGLRQSAFEDDAVESLFENAGLRAWADLYQEDLARVWDHRGQWASMEEFLLLNRHAERVLWQFGMFPWKNPEGQIRVEIPVVTDAAYLTGIWPALKVLVWRLRRWLAHPNTVKRQQA